MKLSSPDREPDFEFENFCKITQTVDRMVKYWVEEGIREIVELDGHVEIDFDVDVEGIYNRNKAIFNNQPHLLMAVTDSVDKFLKGYENYLIEKELLRD